MEGLDKYYNVIYGGQTFLSDKELSILSSSVHQVLVNYTWLAQKASNSNTVMCFVCTVP